jgi:hypothetical protein
MLLRFAMAIALTVPGMYAQVPGAKPVPVMTGKDTSGYIVFEGKLIDAQCHGDEEKCRVSKLTKDFGLILKDNTFLKFDEGGNEKVKTFLKESKQGRKMLTAKLDAAKRITVKAGGIRTGNTFNLENIK